MDVDSRTYQALYDLYDASKALRGRLGLPNSLGGPDLPDELNRWIGAVWELDQRKPRQPKGGEPPEPRQTEDLPF